MDFRSAYVKLFSKNELFTQKYPTMHRAFQKSSVLKIARREHFCIFWLYLKLFQLFVNYSQSFNYIVGLCSTYLANHAHVDIIYTRHGFFYISLRTSS
jgi:hypothetical protein